MPRFELHKVLDNPNNEWKKLREKASPLIFDPIRMPQLTAKCGWSI